MARAHHHPVVQAASAAHYLPLLVDPIDPLAEQVGKALAAEVKQLSTPVLVKGAKKAALSELVSVELHELEARISALVARVLDRSLSSRTAEGTALRMALIARLANAQAGSEVVTEQAKAPAADALLTTAEAAAKLEVSRPYVSMLCDQGKLGEVVMTEGGHRRIRSSAVNAYLSARTKQHEGAKSPREAAVEAGLYDFPEGHFKNVARGKPESSTSAKVVKASSKRRS